MPASGLLGTGPLADAPLGFLGGATVYGDTLTETAAATDQYAYTFEEPLDEFSEAYDDFTDNDAAVFPGLGLAFGTLIGTKTNFSLSPGTGLPVTFGAPGVVVTRGDLIVLLYAMAGAAPGTFTARDNLGNTYTLLTASTGNAGINYTFFARAKASGTLTSVQGGHNTTKNDVAAVAAVFAGPFLPTPLDQNPASATDTASAYLTNTTSALTLRSELAIGYFAQSTAGGAMAAAAPFTLAGYVASAASGTASSVSAALTYNVLTSIAAVSASTTSTPNRTTSAGIATFRQLVVGKGSFLTFF